MRESSGEIIRTPWLSSEWRVVSEASLTHLGSSVYKVSLSDDGSPVMTDQHWERHARLPTLPHPHTRPHSLPHCPLCPGGGHPGQDRPGPRPLPHPWHPACKSDSTGPPQVPESDLAGAMTPRLSQSCHKDTAEGKRSPKWGAFCEKVQCGPERSWSWLRALFVKINECDWLWL